jgi:small-conductance mechanosensitive channel
VVQQPSLHLTRTQLLLLASWLTVAVALAVVGVVTWLQWSPVAGIVPEHRSHPLLAEAFWVASAVVAVAVVAVAFWYRSRPGATRRW